MNYKSLNESILSVTNPQPKNEALNSLQENIDLYNAVLPYTVGLQSVITLVMIEALLDGSGPISGTVSLFKNLMKKWKARVLGGKLSADEAQSFIAEYEKLSASLPTGKRNFLKASFNKMEQAAKAGDKSKLGAIATEVKDYLARNSAEVKEDYETPLRKAENEKAIKNLTKKEKDTLGAWAAHPADRLHSPRSYMLQDKFVTARRKLEARTALQQKERKSKKTYGMGGKIVEKATEIKDYLARNSAEVKEEQEYIEMLESALISIAEELECSVEELIEKADYSKVHYGLPIPKGRIDYLTRAEKAKGKLGGLKGKGKYRTSIADPKNKMGT